MNKENWNPGHSTHKGYPYAGVATKQTLVSRPLLTMDANNKISIEWDREAFKQKVQDDQGNRTPFEDFLLFRLYEYQDALSIAEGQVEDLLHEDPFLPEKFGFEIMASSGNDIHTPPVQIYVNKFDDTFSLFRKPGDSTLDSFNPALWTLVKKTDEGMFNETDLSLPCARIAYAALYALGVKMEAEVIEEKVTETEKEIIFVDFKRSKGPAGDKQEWKEPFIEFTVGFPLGTREEMLAAAKSFIENHPVNPHKNVLDEELTIGLSREESQKIYENKLNKSAYDLLKEK